jgi:16S rRNA (guanine966-N2)-methyltransferase
LKILSGDARGRNLKTPPKSAPVRPILARIKKSIFDILQPRLPNCRFLDLYAGTGSVGLEALSRGATIAVFVEQDADSAAIVKKNIEILRYGDKASVVRASALEDLTFLPKPFDLIFMGPPYKDLEKKALALTEPTLANIAKSGLLAPGGWVLGQHHKKEKVETLPEGCEKFREKVYGDSVVSFFKWDR